MATVVPYQGAMDPLGLALGQGLGQGITTGWQQRRIGSDVDALLAWLQAMQAAQSIQRGFGQPATIGQLPAPIPTTELLPPGQMPPGLEPIPSGESLRPGQMPPGVEPIPTAQAITSSMMPFPKMRTPEGRQMLLEMQLGQMLNPLQQAQVGYYDAQRREALAREQALLNPPSEPMAGRPRRVGKDDPSGLPEGSVVQEDRYGNTKILWQPEVKAEAPERVGPSNQYGLPAGTVVQTDRSGDMKIIYMPSDPEKDKTEFERGLEILGDPQKWSALSKPQQEAYRYRFGLASRPPDVRQNTWQEQVDYWQTILRQTYKTGDWGAMLGEVVEGLEGLNTTAKQAIERLLQSKGATTTLMMKDREGNVWYVPGDDVMKGIDMGYEIVVAPNETQ